MLLPTEGREGGEERSERTREGRGEQGRERWDKDPGALNKTQQNSPKMHHNVMAEPNCVFSNLGPLGDQSQVGPKSQNC